MILDEENYLAHYGILRRSGRYPWGSGGNVSQRSQSFFDTIESLKAQGFSEKQMASFFSTKEHPFTVSDLRNLKTIARNAKKAADISQAQRLKETGMSNMAIGKEMGINESSVRSLLAPGQADKTQILHNTADMLKRQVEEKGYLDVGAGTEFTAGVSKEKMGTALAILKDQGYVVHNVKLEQPGTGQMTEYKVLALPGTTQKQVWENRHSIRQIQEFSDNGGRSFLGVKDPISIPSSRVGINYKEDGGHQADGVIYVRPGKDDISLGGARYAQVRIKVDGTHYLKGMAVYKDDLPDGVDLLFNTNKSKADLGTNKLAAMKPIKDDPDNPFGSVVRQIYKKDETGVPRPELGLASAMNIVGSKEGMGAEGGWGTWSKSLSSQVLSKQSPLLAKQQLDMTYERRKSDLDEILALTNPAVKRKLLETYADSVDSAAVHLKAAALPRQASHVILPVNTLKPTEVYAPNYRNGERVALIRYPHGGKFEIPELTVNNNHPQAKSLLGRAPDAIGINHKVAERLSGADFDGDTVLVIPNSSGRIATSRALEGLKGFDPQTAYKGYEGMPKMSAKTKQHQMGLVSNLITDMTIQGASDHELAAAVRHSMVVIDAEKHGLNYKKSAIDNGIPNLMSKYQGRAQGGASTLISRASSEKRVPQRVNRPMAKGGPIDKATGRRVYEPTGATYVNKKGKTVLKTTGSTKLAETDDARTLLSRNGGTKIEKVYADHSNSLKSLANQARRELVSTPSVKYSPSAKAAYRKEVESLDAKLNIALRNAPRERQAVVLANSIIKAKRQANPGMDGAEIKKIRGQALTEARLRTGAKKEQVEITDREWDAIQAGAVSNNKLTKILQHTDIDRVKELATPRTKPLMTATKLARATAMKNSGYTQAEIADALGVSLTTLKTGIGG